MTPVGAGGPLALVLEANLNLNGLKLKDITEDKRGEGEGKGGGGRGGEEDRGVISRTARVLPGRSIDSSYSEQWTVPVVTISPAGQVKSSLTITVLTQY